MQQTTAPTLSATGGRHGLTEGNLQALEDIPYGNKIALCDLKSGQKIVKCGGIIGQCTEPIKTGELVHIHNVKSLIADIPVSFKKEIMRQMNICSKEGN